MPLQERLRQLMDEKLRRDASSIPHSKKEADSLYHAMHRGRMELEQEREDHLRRMTVIEAEPRMAPRPKEDYPFTKTYVDHLRRNYLRRDLESVGFQPFTFPILGRLITLLAENRETGQAAITRLAYFLQAVPTADPIKYEDELNIFITDIVEAAKEKENDFAQPIGEPYPLNPPEK